MECTDIKELMPGATSCVENFVKIIEGDKILIITDNPKIAEALAEASVKVGGEVNIIYLPRIMRPIKHLSNTLKSMILGSDVVFTPFEAFKDERSFRREICELAKEGAGRKIAHMIGFTEGMFRGPGMLTLNSKEMQKMVDLTEKLAVLLSATKKIKIRSAIHDETELSLELEGWNRSGIVSTGHILKGSWGNLPSGEAFVVPKKGTANGTIVVDMAISELPSSELPLTMKITQGKIILESIKDGISLKNLLKDYSEDARTICEFGIGTNPKPCYGFSVIEIEKIIRTIHIAIGSNSVFGGDIKTQVPHTDMVIARPNVSADNLLSNGTVDIIEEGTIMEEQIDSFFKVNYTCFSKELDSSAFIKVKQAVTVEEEGDKLYRCWSDFRGHKLRIAIGDDETAIEVRKVWSLIDSKNIEKVKDVLLKFDKRFKVDGEHAYQLLNVLEKFGIIDITKHTVPPPPNV